MISKALSTSQRYANLHVVAGERAEFCQALYPLLVAHADDFGRLAGDVFTVKHMVVPTSPRREADVQAALAALAEVGLIEWYDTLAQGVVRKCIQVCNFDSHQVGLHKRIRSNFPDSSGMFPEIPSEQKRTEQKRTEQKGSDHERFERFWVEYPRKVAKDAALKEWLKSSPDEALTTRMIAAVRRHKASQQWQKDAGEFVPHPRTWLHQKRWEDVASVVVQGIEEPSKAQLQTQKLLASVRRKA